MAEAKHGNRRCPAPWRVHADQTDRSDQSDRSDRSCGRAGVERVGLWQERTAFSQEQKR